MTELVPLYKHDNPQMMHLDHRLSETLQGIPGSDAPGETEFTATRGDWSLVLKSAEGALQAVSMTRCGSESYNFERRGEVDWAAVDPGTRFADAHFYNLVHLATMSGLEWAEAPATVTV